MGRLRMEQQQSVERTKTLSRNNDRGYKAEILVLAKIKEKELIFLGQQWLVNNISAEITRIYKKEEIKIWPWVPDFLPSKYKNYDNKERTVYTEQSSSHLPGASGYSIEQCSSNISGTGVEPLASFTPSSSVSVTHIFEEMSKAIAYTPVSEMSSAHSIWKRGTQQLEKLAKGAHVALEPSSQASHIDQVNDSRTEERQPVKTDTPRPHGSLTRDAVALTKKCIDELYDRIEEFPPEILERDKDIAAGFHTLNSLLASALDLKYSKSWLEWFRTEKNRDMFGKHAAAVMSFSLTNLCAECSDERRREWVRMDPVYAYQYSSFECLRCKYQMDAVCPACNLPMKERNKSIIAWECSNCNNTTPLKRDLTREQVGDKSNIIVDFSLQVLEHIPFLISFFMWYAEWIEPYVAGRRTRLSEDLSDRA